MNTEEELAAAMRRRASGISGHPDLGDVVARARRIQRRRRTTAVVGAVVAVAAIAVPTSLVLDGSPDTTPPVLAHTPTPSPTPPPTTPSPTPSHSPSSSPTSTATHQVPANAVGRIALGSAPMHTYLEDGVIHLASGGTTAMPSAAGRVAAFTAYHGGWLVADPESGQVQLIDGQGTVQRHGAGTARFAVSSDGTLTAFTMGGEVHAGIASGMSDGESSAPVDPTTGAAIGFLSGGRVLYATGATGAHRTRFGVLGGAGVGNRLDALQSATASTDQGDLVAGTDAQGGLVVSAATGATLWSRAGWVPDAFSPDGRYVAATYSANGGDFSEVAILDARTGHPVAHAALLGNGISMLGTPAFEDETHVLFVGAQKAGDSAAILRLDTTGRLDRATQLASPGPDAGSFPFVLSTGS